jgi:hypothetical protein
MKLASLSLSSVSLIAIFLSTASPIRADDGADGFVRPNRVCGHELNLRHCGRSAEHRPGPAKRLGRRFTPNASPFWISDNATGCSTLYDGQGAIQALQVSLPLPGGSVPATACKHADPKNPPNPTPAAPTGLVWNPTSGTTGFSRPRHQPFGDVYLGHRRRNSFCLDRWVDPA